MFDIGSGAFGKNQPTRISPHCQPADRLGRPTTITLKRARPLSIEIYTRRLIFDSWNEREPDRPRLCYLIYLSIYVLIVWRSSRISINRSRQIRTCQCFRVLSEYYSSYVYTLRSRGRGNRERPVPRRRDHRRNYY